MQAFPVSALTLANVDLQNSVLVKAFAIRFAQPGGPQDNDVLAGTAQSVPIVIEELQTPKHIAHRGGVMDDLPAARRIRARDVGPGRKRRGPSDRSWTRSAVHFEPMISAHAATAQVRVW